MSSYAFWNNKGGVGKSFLCFISACEYAEKNRDTDIFVIDMCPQANTSEMLLGGQDDGAKNLKKIMSDKKGRLTIGGYLEERLSSPFIQINDPMKFVKKVCEFNKKVPENVYLIPGDNLVEILAEAIRQTSQLSVPVNSWSKVVCWVKELQNNIIQNRQKDCVFFLDCNPSFAIYTQLAIAASENIIVPFTADESSRRGIENIIALLYAQGDDYIANYARLSFYKRAKEEGIALPKLHTFVSNRVTLFDGEPSKAFQAASKQIKTTISNIAKKHRSIFAYPKVPVEDRFVDFPDYHGVSIFVGLTGTPIHKLKQGPKNINGERVQINGEPLLKYKDALNKFVSYL